MSALAGAALAKARGAKDRGLRGDDSPDLAPTLTAYRDGRPVIVAVFPATARGEADMLRAAQFLPAGCCADEVVATFEAWASTGGEDDPRTGKRWEPEAMGDYIARHGRGGVVVDAVFVVHARRDGVAHLARQTFTPGVNGAPAWAEEQHTTTPGGGTADGGVIAALRAGFAAPDPGVADLVEAASGDEAQRVERWVGVDRAAAKLMRQAGAASVAVVAGAFEVARVAAIAAGDARDAEAAS